MSGSPPNRPVRLSYRFRKALNADRLGTELSYVAPPLVGDFAPVLARTESGRELASRHAADEGTAAIAHMAPNLDAGFTTFSVCSLDALASGHVYTYLFCINIILHLLCQAVPFVVSARRSESAWPCFWWPPC